VHDKGNAEELDYRGALFHLLKLDSLEVAVTITSGESESRVRVIGTLDLDQRDAGPSLASRLASAFGPGWQTGVTLRLTTAMGSLALKGPDAATATLPDLPAGDVEVDVDDASFSLSIQESQLDRAWCALGPGDPEQAPVAVGLAMADGTTVIVQERSGE
jgi:hypothetical protein